MMAVQFILTKTWTEGVLCYSNVVRYKHVKQISYRESNKERPQYNLQTYHSHNCYSDVQTSQYHSNHHPQPYF
jgi:hypothetical protein